MSTSYVDQQLEATALRIAEAVAAASEPRSRGDDHAWLDACLRRELEIDARGDETEWPLARLGLSASELRVLWVLLAQEVDPAARMNLRELSTEDEVDVGYDVLRRVVYGHRPTSAAWQELAETGALRRSCLIDVVDDSTMPTHRLTFRISQRVLALLHGDDCVDRELIGVVRAPVVTRSDHLFVNGDARTRVTRAIATREPALVIVVGPDGCGRRSLVTAIAREQGVDVLAIDLQELAAKPKVLARQLRILARECLLTGRIPLLLNLDGLHATDDVADPFAVIETVLGDRFTLATATRTPARRWSRSPDSIEVPPLTGAECASLWKRSLPGASDGDGELLATMYPLAPALIASVGSVALTEAQAQPLEPRHISIGLRRVLDDRLAGLATRITVSQDWNDLVLPEDQTLAVVELLARIRARRRVYEDWGFARKLGKGLGVTALFSGPPGTGKTMCAGLIAKDLGTELYQVDLGKVVSKWIGETEKNLGALFDAAEASHAVLLFDEADSLFGKRTAVQTSNDRHANQETNYLLQRIEAFTGICILTTNHDPAIDEAFQRRLSVRVRFPMPDEDERVRLWGALIPGDAPVDPTLDLAALAKKYVMAGGNIRNAVLRAAFLAADANEQISDYHMRQAAQLEYEGMGKLAMKTA